MIEMTELDLALKFLKSPFFEKKIKGINEIKDILEKVEMNGLPKPIKIMTTN
jgi:hypothetical protein